MMSSFRTTGSEKVSFGTPRAEPESDEIDLTKLFSMIWRGKWIIMVCTVIAIFLGGFYAYLVATPFYKSTVVVILETKQDQILDLQSVSGGLTGDTTEVNSEVEVLRARSLMGKAVDRLDLVNDPEFNSRLRPLPMVAVIKGRVKNLIGFRRPSEPISEEEEQHRIRDSVVSALLSKTSVSNVRQSLVFRITAETNSAAKSALIADTLAEQYILNQIDVKFQATEQATAWLSNRVSELQIELENAEAAASDFSASTQLVSVEGLQGLERQIKELRDRIVAAEQSRGQLSSKVQKLEAAGTNAKKAALSDDAQLSRFAQRDDTDSAFQEAFDKRLELVLQRARLDLKRAEQQLEALRTSEADLDQQLSRQGQDLIALQQLTREAEAVRLLYEHFLTRLKETSAQQGIQQADSRILSNAVVPAVPSAPRKSMIMALSALLGMFLGTGFILLREVGNNGFRTVKELEAFTGYTVMGQLPAIPAQTRAGVLDYIATKPTSAAAEAMRNLRTSVLLSNVDNPPKVIVLTSSVPGEGKTTNSLALAQNLLGLGKSVLLIEGDIRRKTLNAYFPDLPGIGLVSVLSGEKTLEDAVCRPPAFGADVLAGEKTSTNAADLFASDRFREFIDEVRAKYDAVIIDTPPVLVVPDARIIAQVADAVLFSIKWDQTTKPQVEEALRLFHNSNQRITGLVLSHISAKGMKRYGYGGRYGAYSSYGAEYYTS